MDMEACNHAPNNEPVCLTCLDELQVEKDRLLLQVGELERTKNTYKAALQQITGIPVPPQMSNDATRELRGIAVDALHDEYERRVEMNRAGKPVREVRVPPDIRPGCICASGFDLSVPCPVHVEKRVDGPPIHDGGLSPHGLTGT